MFKNIIRVTISNIINFGATFLVGFVLPLFLSVEGYGYFREYSLYLSFVFIFNFGFNDGIYIKYGGKELYNLDKNTIIEEHSFIVLFQLIVFAVLFLSSKLIQNEIFSIFTFVVFFLSIINYHNNFFQAIGNFKIFSVSNIWRSIIYIVMLLFGILVLRSKNYFLFIWINVISYMVHMIYYEYYFYKTIGPSSFTFTSNFLGLFKLGIYILIANMSMTFVGNIGSWIVNYGFDIKIFAQYSFQSSILNIIILIANAVGMVFYNVLAKSKNDFVKINLLKNISLVLGVILTVGIFLLKPIITFFFIEYRDSIQLLTITFIALPYIIVSKILISNLYKTNRTEKKYFKDAIIFAILSFVFSVIVYLVTKDIYFIAFSTTISYIIWYLYSVCIEFNDLAPSIKEWGLIISHFGIFIVLNLINNWVGLCFYLFYILVVVFFYREDVKKFIQYSKIN
ncbi:oligosaccharide flippase family protein [Globicatella sulfidifaciens]